MSLLIDTSALVAARNADDRNHNKALDIMTRALKGEFGKLYISDYIFDEAVTIAYIRTGNKNFFRRPGTICANQTNHIPVH